MARTPLWMSIAQTLRDEIARGDVPAGGRLPTEAKLSARFGVNRHTVRHALSVLADDGLVYSRRGSGVFVTHENVDYPISRRVRFHQNLKAAGKLPGKRVLSLTTRPAESAEAEALRLQDGDQVHAYEGLSLADAQPLAVFLSVFPATRFPNLLDHLQNGGSVTRALAAEGLSDYTRHSTRVQAATATSTQAVHLNLREGQPVLLSIAVNVDRNGCPIEFGRSWFAGERVTLTLENA